MATQNSLYFNVTQPRSDATQTEESANETFASEFPTRTSADEIAVKTDANVDGFVTEAEHEAALKSDKKLINFTADTTLSQATTNYSQGRINPFAMGMTKMTTAQYAQFLSMDNVQEFAQ